jgi:hypothetical protein
MLSLVQLCSELIMVVTSLQLFLWWKGGVGRSSTPLAHVPEPIVLHGGRAGWGGVVLLSHTYRSQYFVWWKGVVENDGLGRCICMLQDQRHIARTRTGANSISWW